MASLYQTTNNVRKLVVVVLIVMVGIMLFNFFVDFSNEPLDVVSENERFYMFADRKFGDITRPTIPTLEFDSDDNATFSLESVHGAYPDVAFVYKIEQPTDKLLNFSNAKITAQALGFDPEDFADLGGNNFSWSSDDGTRVLKYNKISQVWSLETDYFTNIAALSDKDLLGDEEDYAREIYSLLDRLGFSTKGFPDGRAQVTFARLASDGIFSSVDRITQSNFIHVSVFRRLDLANLKDSSVRPEPPVGQDDPPEVDGLVYSDDPKDGQINFMVSNRLDNYTNDVFGMNFTNYEYATDAGSYLIITPEEAWSRVQRGEGSLTLLQPQGNNFFADFRPINVDRYIADARRTELAYWEPNEWTGYVYPIYIFKGRAELEDGRQASFMIYVEAIKRLD